jgi:hypothetical protein
MRNEVYKSKRRQIKPTGFGLCLSGLTIKKAIDIISKTRNVESKVFISIGAVDILYNHDMLDIMEDFRDLLVLLKTMGKSFVVSTIPPLANRSFDPIIRHKVHKINEFLRAVSRNIVDIWKSAITEDGRIDFSFFNEKPRSILNGTVSFLPWSMRGRVQVLQTIRNELANEYSLNSWPIF